MPRFQILPTEEKFYDWFDKAAGIILEAAELFAEMMSKFDNVPGQAARITELEHQGDFVVHEITELLARTFILPLDREDIYDLTGRMDDVLDLIEEASDSMLLYKVESPKANAVALAQVILESARVINQAVPMLRDRRQLKAAREHAIEMHRLENEADRILRLGIAELLEGRDAFEFFRWKAIYDLLEDATDRCEDVADVLNAIVMKNL